MHPSVKAVFSLPPDEQKTIRKAADAFAQKEGLQNAEEAVALAVERHCTATDQTVVNFLTGTMARSEVGKAIGHALRDELFPRSNAELGLRWD